MSKPVALTIAGSDPTGGAGLQADLKTFAALDVYGASAVSVLTAQNTRRFEVEPVSAAFVSAQIEAVFEAFDVAAIKIGMLGGASAVGAVIKALARYNADGDIPVVLDPVIRASNEGKALDPRGVKLLRGKLIPRCTLIKPNLSEAAQLLDCPLAGSLDEMRAQGEPLLTLGSPYVLLSGGHMSGKNAVDLLFERDGKGGVRVRELSAPRVAGGDVHGTGCTLSAAITAALASGLDMEQAVSRAKALMTQLMDCKKQSDKDGFCISLDHQPLTLSKIGKS